MKRTIKLLALAAALAVFAVPALAQSDQCTDENKDLWYAKTFLPNFKGTAEQQKTADEAAEKYIAACPADAPSAYMQKFVDAYKKLKGDQGLLKDFTDAVSKKDNAKIISLGNQLVAANPDNALVYILMTSAGLNDPSF